MAGIVAILLATAWSALVVGTVAESAGAPGSSIVFLRHTLLTTGTGPGILILCGLAASAGFACATAVAFARGRRLDRRTAAELDARSQETTTQTAGDAARTRLLSWRIAELRTSMDELTERRDRMVAELELARRRTNELRALAEDYKRSLDELQQRLIVLPDIEDELAQRRARRKASDPTR